MEVECRLDELNAEISQLQRVLDERARDNNYARLQQSMNQSSTVADYTDGARTRRTTVRPSTSGRRDDEEWTGSDDWRVDSDITFRRRHPARDERICERIQELATPRQSFSSRTRDERMVGRVSSRSSTVTLPQVEDVLPGSDGAVQRRNGRGDECRSVDDYAVRGRRNVMRLESGDDRHVLSDGPCRLHPSAAKKYREDDREVRAEGQLRQRRRRVVPAIAFSTEARSHVYFKKMVEAGQIRLNRECRNIPKRCSRIVHSTMVGIMSIKQLIFVGH